MHTLRNSNIWKVFVALFLAALLLTGVIGTAAASSGGQLTSLYGDTGVVSAGIVPNGDPGPDPGFARPFVFVPDIRFKVDNNAVVGAVRVFDQSNRPVTGALVSVLWTFPDGTTMKLAGETRGNGYADFLVEKLLGENKLQVLDVQYSGIPFSRENSQLLGTINIGK